MSEISKNVVDEPMEAQKKKRRWPFLLLALFLALVAALVAWHFLAPPSIEDVRGGWFYDQDAAQIQEAVDHAVEEGYFNMTINSEIPVYEGVTAIAGIQNIEGNHFDCTVTITLDDGTVVYESGGLSPGQELKSVNLNQPLESGDYEATALFEIYDRNDEHTKAGQTAAKVTLRVQ